MLDSAAVAAIVSGAENLQVKARVIVESALTGLHRARLHGSSIEFAEHKEYSPGDEVRHIDWKAYAKLDRYYVKQFEQESQLTAHLVLDASGSMAYQGQGMSKLEYASYLLAALAYLMIHQRDRVGLTVFGDPAIDGSIPARTRPSHLHDLLGVIQSVSERGAAGAETASTALDRVAELAGRRRSLIVLASDIFDEDGDAVAVLRRLRAQHHDVVFFHILDPDEIDFPFTELSLFESLENPRKMLVNPGAIRRRYRRKLTEFLSRTETDCVTGGVEYHQVITSQALDQTLLDFVSMRTSNSLGRHRAWSS